MGPPADGLPKNATIKFSMGASPSVPQTKSPASLSIAPSTVQGQVDACPEYHEAPRTTKAVYKQDKPRRRESSHVPSSSSLACPPDVTFASTSTVDTITSRAPVVKYTSDCLSETQRVSSSYPPSESRHPRTTKEKSGYSSQCPPDARTVTHKYIPAASLDSDTSRVPLQGSRIDEPASHYPMSMMRDQSMMPATATGLGNMERSNWEAMSPVSSRPGPSVTLYSQKPQSEYDCHTSECPPAAEQRRVKPVNRPIPSSISKDGLPLVHDVVAKTKSQATIVPKVATVPAAVAKSIAQKTYTNVAKAKSIAPAFAKSIHISPVDDMMAARQSSYRSLGPAQQAEQDRWANTQFTRSTPCPAGFVYKRVSRGYQCDGGHHLVTDFLLAEGKGGVCFLSEGDESLRRGGDEIEGPYYDNPSRPGVFEYGGRMPKPENWIDQLTADASSPGHANMSGSPRPSAPAAHNVGGRQSQRVATQRLPPQQGEAANYYNQGGQSQAQHTRRGIDQIQQQQQQQQQQPPRRNSTPRSQHARQPQQGQASASQNQAQNHDSEYRSASSTGTQRQPEQYQPLPSVRPRQQSRSRGQAQRSSRQPTQINDAAQMQVASKIPQGEYCEVGTTYDGNEPSRLPAGMSFGAPAPTATAFSTLDDVGKGKTKPKGKGKKGWFD